MISKRPSAGTHDRRGAVQPRPPGPLRAGRTIVLVFICSLLSLVCLAVYAQMLDFDFVNFDDDVYVTANPPVRAGLTASGVGWAFATFHESNWHPLTWLS